MNQLANADLAEIHGGFAPLIVWVVTAGAGAIISAHFTNIFDNWSDFKAGVADGYKTVSN